MVCTPEPGLGSKEQPIRGMRLMTRFPTLNQNILRGQLLPRIILMWLFVGVLATAAASFSQGSRYTLPTDPSPSQAIAGDYPAPVGDPAAPAIETVDADGERSVFPSGTVPSSECLDRGPKQQPCCIRYNAPRAEPSLVIRKEPGLMEAARPWPRTAGHSPLSQHEPRRHGLTVQQLSVSRT